MLQNQGLIEGLEISRTDASGRRNDAPFTVKLPSGTISLSEDEAAMFLLGASTVFFGWYAQQPVSRFNRK
ncbi:hypothetical protein RIF23_02315 [Lipingzhangella sp. LS1_29]|uniref:Uncharacterized protein n=1 Tax=Lipingzhangella rawalii TaxID=2055835 RepID=A0ABU2H1F7_9ACTN|nr:hypothetical protein [Lipingzhangella rawalii]MDS1269126.1 hypothetical protein [Lipingzhangella rawalii]